MQYLIDSIRQVDLISFVIGYMFCVIIFSLYHLGYEVFKLWQERKANTNGKN